MVDPALNREIEEILRYTLSKKFTSVSYAVMVEGELVASQALGATGGPEPRPATTDCTYNVASISKIYTTVAVMQLAERGLLELDAPIVTYLPDFRTLNPGYEKITLRHCLSHSCALPGTMWIDFSVTDQSRVDYYRDALDFYAHSHLKAEPGVYSVYCNDGFTLAEMAVAAVCEEKSFSEYCRLHITDPLGAWSSRFARSYNPDYPMIAQGKGPAEQVTGQGMGGLTTTMEHLALFGNQFLLGEGAQILSEASMREMRASQGKTFLQKDETSARYGLGWDNVRYTHPDYDLGEDAFRKGGASFQFASQLLIVPKYRAVVALSQTYDCELDGHATALQLLAAAMLRVKGVNITRYKVIPDSFMKRFGGDYLNSTASHRVEAHGAFLYVLSENSRGKRHLWSPPFGYTGRDFVNATGRRLAFEANRRGRYMLTALRSPMAPLAERVKDGPALSPTWRKRLGKTYINISVTPYDEILCDMMAGFTLAEYRDHKGILLAAFQNGGTAAEPAVMDSPVKPLSANVATGFAYIPDEPSRDLVSLIFSREGGAEYCTAASYTFRDAESLPLYTGQPLAEMPRDPHRISGRVPGAAAFRLGMKLEKLPEIPTGGRLLLLDEHLVVIYDSLMKPGDFAPMEKGYGIFC